MSEGWSVEVEVPVAWGDMDAFQHVNNAVFLRWFESARIAYFMKVEMPVPSPGSTGGQGPILARMAVDYRQPVTFPDTITVRARVPKVGNTSLVMQYQAESRQRGVVADGEGVVVMFDYAKGEKAPIDVALRARIEKAEGR